MKPFEVHKEIPTPLQSNLHFGHYSLKPKDVGVRRHGEGLWAGHCGVAVEADGTGARSKLASTFAERRRGWPW